MKRNKNLHTSFINFIIEKYNKEKKISDEETNISDKEIIDEIDKKEIPDDDYNDEVQEDDILNNLIKEYEEMEKKYKTLKNDKLYNNRK